MMQRDYILRMIEEMGKFLSRLIGLRKQDLTEKGLQELDDFLTAHFKYSTDDLMAQGFVLSLKKLEKPMESYPDELGQLLFTGAEMALDHHERSKAQVLFQLASAAYRLAEKNGKTYRFNRMVEMNAIREQLALMGIDSQHL